MNGSTVGHHNANNVRTSGRGQSRRAGFGHSSTTSTVIQASPLPSVIPVIATHVVTAATPPSIIPFSCSGHQGQRSIAGEQCYPVKRTNTPGFAVSQWSTMSFGHAGHQGQGQHNNVTAITNGSIANGEINQSHQSLRRTRFKFRGCAFISIITVRGHSNKRPTTHRSTNRRWRR